jgi:hypothetical protein
MNDKKNATTLLADLGNAARENPVAAGLIGLGALWMFYGGARVTLGNRAESSRRTRSRRDAYEDEADDDTTESLLDTARDRLESSTRAMQDVSGDIADTVYEQAGNARSALTDALVRQPLLLGAIGAAIGAGIAVAFPATKVESELMGEAAGAARQKADEMVSETVQKAKDTARGVVDEVVKEANAQGLSPEGAKEALSGMAEKAAAVAEAAQKSARERMS